MKTIEQKAKAYDEATKVIKDNLDALNEITETGAEVVNIQSIKNCFYRAFPELKESEDERIRKGLINGFSECLMNLQYSNNAQKYWHNIKIEDIFSWLEKQREQKLKDKHAFKSIPRLLEMIKPTNKAKVYCQKLIDSLLQEGYATDAKIVSYCLKQMNGEKVAMATMDEQKLAWSEEDDAYKLFAISAVEDYYDEKNPLQKALVDWLESLKERIGE